MRQPCATGATSTKVHLSPEPGGLSVIPRKESGSGLKTIQLTLSDRKYKGLRIKNGKWAHHFKHQGNPYCGSSGLAAIDENVEAAYKIRADHKRRVESGEVQRNKRVPLRDAIRDFLEWYRGEHPNGNHKWAASLMSSFEMYFLVVNPRALHQMEPADMEDFKTWRRAEHNIHGNSLRKQLIMIRQFFAFARKKGWLNGDPLFEVKIPAEQGTDVMHVLSPAEEKAYFAAAAEASQDLFDVGMIMLEQGCRPDEVMSLEQEQVNLAERKFTVWFSTSEGKTKNAHRTLKMTSVTYPIFARRLFVPNRWLFPSPKNDGPRTTLQKKQEEVREACGVDCRLYDMRHTFATRFALQHGPGCLPNLAKLLGHADLSLLMRYIHPSQEDMDRAMEYFDKGQRKTRKKAAQATAQKEQLDAVVQ